MTSPRAVLAGVLLLAATPLSGWAEEPGEAATQAAGAAEKPVSPSRAEKQDTTGLSSQAGEAVKAVEQAKTKMEEAVNASEDVAQKASQVTQTEAARARAAEAAKTAATRAALAKAQENADAAKAALAKAQEGAKTKAEAAVKAADDALKATHTVAATINPSGPDPGNATEAARRAAEAAKKAGEVAVDLSSGSLSYGVTTTLLRLQSSRRASDPARVRDYQMGIEKLPLDLGFQFSYRPRQRPYRLDTTDGAGFQMISVGGMLSVTMNPQIASQAEVILGFVLSFFNESVSLGLGFDLYRGVPVRGADGAAGTGTASTGLLGWACSKQGEITPENFSLLLTFNVSKIAGSVGGDK
jgi:hypothetical protein